MAPPFRPLTPQKPGPFTDPITRSPLAPRPLVTAPIRPNPPRAALRGPAPHKPSQRPAAPLTPQQAETKAYAQALAEARANAPIGNPEPNQPASTPKKKPGTNVSAMQQFLAGKGYNIAVDGVNGPMTQAAASDFRGSRNPHAFNIGHGLAHSDAPAAPAGGSGGGGPSPAPTPPSRQQPTPAPKPTAARTAPAAGGQTDLQQAQQYVNALLNPVIKQITDAENARATSGQNAIQGYTSAEQKLLGTYSPLAAQEYGGAMQSQNAIDAALRSSLTGQGGDQANALGARLASLSVDPGTAARVVGAAGSTAAGAANANYAQGSATLSALGQQGAAAQDEARAQPGIAGLAGLQSSKALQAQTNTDLHDQLAAIGAKAPGLVQNLVSSLQNARTAQQRNQLAALIAAGKTDEALKVANANNATRVSIANANNQTRTSIANSNNAVKLQLTAAKKAGIPAKGALTDSQLTKLVDSWKNGKVQNANVAQTDADGNVVRDQNGAVVYKSVSGSTGTLGYGQAYKRLRAFGKSDQQARAVLNTAYQRGQQGRAWVTNEEQAALSKAGQPSKATLVNGHGVLSPKQYAALKAAGKLPPGQLTAEGAYVIAQGF